MNRNPRRCESCGDESDFSPCPSCRLAELRTNHARSRSASTGRRPLNAQWYDAVTQSPSSHRAKNVAGALAFKYMDWHTLGDCYPGIARLVADTGLSESSVRRALQELVSAGFLVVEAKGGSGGAAGKRATRYRGQLPAAYARAEAS